MRPNQDTSWQKVAPWYHKLVSKEGHYYHEHVVLPGVIQLLQLQSTDRLLDLGCGQGVLSRSVPPLAEYLGLDMAEALIKAARNTPHPPHYRFQVADVTKPLAQTDERFTHAAIILALQNMDRPEGAIQSAAHSLISGGKLVIVLNHPMFRIPRQSGWGTDEKNKQQYRWVNRYLSPLKIPINMTPGHKTQTTTWSFHRPLQDYMKMISSAGLVVAELEEWVSNKMSQGKAAKMENRSREEIPLFMAILAKKI